MWVNILLNETTGVFAVNYMQWTIIPCTCIYTYKVYHGRRDLWSPC